MQLQHLEAFVTVVDCDTVTDAAQKLHIAQPALSRYIHNLEQELGQTLFDHHGRRLHLTPFGQWTYDKVRHILDEASVFRHGNMGQSWHLGASLTTLTTFLPEVIHLFRDLSPETEIHIEAGLSADIFDLVGSGRVEVGLVSDANSQAYYHVISLFTDPLWGLCPADHSWPKTQVISVQQVDGQPLILMTPRTLLHTDLDALFRSHAVIPDICMEINNVEVIQQMVAAGLGCTILPRSVCREATHHSRWVALPLKEALSSSLPSPQLMRTLGVITLHTGITPGANIWINLCQELASRFQENDTCVPTL